MKMTKFLDSLLERASKEPKTNVSCRLHTPLPQEKPQSSSFLAIRKKLKLILPKITGIWKTLN